MWHETCILCLNFIINSTSFAKGKLGWKLKILFSTEVESFLSIFVFFFSSKKVWGVKVGNYCHVLRNFHTNCIMIMARAKLLKFLIGWFGLWALNKIDIRRLLSGPIQLGTEKLILSPFARYYSIFLRSKGGVAIWLCSNLPLLWNFNKSFINLFSFLYFQVSYWYLLLPGYQ